MIKAIETQYKGYRFRSRLEARWAVFFEKLGLKWEYEPEGFEVDGGVMYLPDFRVVMPCGFTRWYEIKPSNVLEDDKVSLFRKALPDSSGISLLSGDPAQMMDLVQSDDNGGICPRCGAIGSFEYVSCGEDNADIGCFDCDMDTPSGGGHPQEDGVWMPYRPHKGAIIVDIQDWRKFSFLTIPDACVAARSARFEHNERASMAGL